MKNVLKFISGEQGVVSEHLRQVVVPVWTKEECQKSDYGKARLTGNMMCAGYQEGEKDACQGDSGGPMHYEGDTGSMEVIGVVSWGRGCARPKLPGIYTRVANFLPWIEKKLASQCMCSPKNGVRTGFLETIAEQYKSETGNETEVEDESENDNDID